MADRAQLRAFVGRAPDATFFTAYVEGPSTAPLEEGGPFATVEEALAWARERAAWVKLTYGWNSDTGMFSAGEIPVENLRAWPPSAEQLKALDAEVRSLVDGRVDTPEKLGVIAPIWRS